MLYVEYILHDEAAKVWPVAVERMKVVGASGRLVGFGWAGLKGERVV